ncbi:glutamate racemase [Buchnera aphidicola]|uniref:Glutamate racemase n=1 Tax=Buchnera aphidicola str. Ua (Uroleucon ambrosiae) TaxID=1005057 RepID=G2LQ34_BUCUM|nr:glutamate racemase [Buchnera aphidicola]AEO08321.1 glutamate racemase [Buchnera aphidicola str. Ua (Uroleucon ambrosiae)]
MLIFDSGVGGLSILQTIKIVLPNIHYIYFLDNEAFPYGNKTEYFIIQRIISIIKKIKKLYPINIVVIACNTVSTVSVSFLKKKFNLPIIGIFPDIKTAEKITKNNIIGLIATRTTIHSEYIQKLIYQKSFNNIIQIISTNQLALIAEKKIRKIPFAQKDLKSIFKPWINLNIKPDTIILGCTHFLFLKKEIKDTLHLTSSINFIDSRKKIVLDIKNCIYKFNLQQTIKNNIFLYSKHDNYLTKIFIYLKRYQFKKISYINLN